MSLQCSAYSKKKRSTSSGRRSNGISVGSQRMQFKNRRDRQESLVTLRGSVPHYFENKNADMIAQKII